MPRMLRKIAIGLASIVAGLVALYLLAASVLLLLPAPKLTHTSVARTATGVACRNGAGVRCFPMRDGALLAARQLGPLPSEGNGLFVVLLHGVMSSSGELAETAQRLRESTGATVVRLDLRGHGLSTGGSIGRPGDIAHIGQWEEDVADVVSALRRESPGARIVLSGHSMGGGIAVRYALRRKEHRDVPDVDGYLLFAPHFGDKSLTTRKEPAHDSRIAEAAKTGKTEPQILKINVPRLLGLVMLNIVGITQLNGLDTLYFDLPFALPFRAYSFRALASMSPEDIRPALAADAKPMLVLVGAKDEAFLADQYPAVVALHRNGKTVIIPNETHDGIFRNPAAFAAIHEWIGTIQAAG